MIEVNGVDHAIAILAPVLLLGTTSASGHLAHGNSVGGVIYAFWRLHRRCSSAG